MSDHEPVIQNLILAHKALNGMLNVHKELMPGVPGLAIQDYKALNDAPMFARMTSDKIEAGLRTIGILPCRQCKEFISAYQLANCPHCKQKYEDEQAK